MCFITYGFIARARYEMGSLGFRPNSVDEMQLPVFKEIVADSLLRLKETSDAFLVNYHYHWVIKHWEKIKKALNHEKWLMLDNPYSKVDIKRNKAYYSNISIVTNIFSNKFTNIYYEDSIKIEEIQYVKTKNNPFEIVEIDNGSYIFTKDYLKTIKKKKHADKSKAIAEFDMNCVDDKRNKYVSYILYNEDAVKDNFASNVAKSEIEGLIKAKTTLQITRMLSIMITMNMIRRTQQISRINTINRMRRF